MKRRFLTLFILAFLCSMTATGQGYFFSASYNTALPLGETKDYADTYSWRGASIEWRWFIQNRISAGLFFGWNVVHQKVSDDFVNDTRVLSGTQLRTVNAFPLLATGHFYFADDLSFRPYLGLGVGTYHTRQRTTMGIFGVDTNQWQFGLAPSVGATIPIGYDVMANLEIRYNYAFKAGDALNHSYLGINLGLAWSSY